jgi:Sigma-70 region 2
MYPENGPAPDNFQDRVAALSVDPAMRRLAHYYARRHDLAEDILQDTFCAIVNVADPGRIGDLPAYFRRVLRRKAVAMLEIAGPIPTADIDALLATRPSMPGRPGTRRPDCSASTAERRAVLAAQLDAWTRRLDALGFAGIPGRSPDPARYRAVIADCARYSLPALLDGDVSPADIDRLLIRMFPDWFSEQATNRAGHHQRLSRGRRDVRGLLASVIGRDELLA